MGQEITIHIEWDGPHRLDAVGSLTGPTDYGRSIYYYTKDVSVIVYYKDEKAVGVAAIDRPGAGVTSISQARYDELVKLIGRTPKGSDIKRDSSGIHEFSVGDTD